MKKSLLDGDVEWKYNSTCGDGVARVWSDMKLSLRAKGVFAYMESKPKNWKFSSDRIAGDSKDGRRVVLNALNELIDNGYVSRRKSGDGRMFYALSSDPYVGIEPEIVRSPFEGAKVNIEHESMYDGANDYKNADGSVGTIGELSPMPSFDEEDFICINDCVIELRSNGMRDKKARIIANEFWKACDEGGLEQNQKRWEKWKKVYMPILDFKVVDMDA